MRAEAAPTEQIEVFEMYSWQAPGGEWNFAILPTISNLFKETDIMEPSRTIHGTKELPAAFSKLAGQDAPKSLRVVWAPASATYGSKRIKYPPDKVVAEVEELAKANHIQLVGPS